MIAGGNARFARYVRTVASYLGHSSVSMTLNTYADVDPDAKLQAVGKIEDSFDIDMAGICDDNSLSAPVSRPKVPDVTFTIEQLEAMLAQAKRIEEAQ